MAENNNKRLYIDTQQASSSSSSSPSSLSTYYQYEVTTGSLSEKTKYCYTHHINEFLAYFKITDITPLHEFTPKVIKQMVKDYVIHLRDVRKSARSSINVAVAAIDHFFYIIRDDDYKIDWKKVRLEMPPDENIRRDRAYTVEEIQKMLSVCHRLREKVIVLILESTGMRIGAVHTLKIGDLSPKQTKQGKIYKIDVYSESSKHYSAYCNVETTEAIDSYLKERTDDGEIIKNDTPLIRNLYNSLSVKSKVKKLSDAQIGYLVDRIVILSGVKNTFQFTGEAKRGKGFRKFYKTQAEMAGMKPINVELTHGHSIGMSGHYYRPQESEVLNDYMAHASDALTIDPNQRLQQKVQQLEGQQAQEIAMLKEKLKSYDKTLAIHEEYYEKSEKTFAEASKLIQQLGRAYMGLDDPRRLKHIEKHINKINDLPPALRIVVLEALKDKDSQGSD